MKAGDLVKIKYEGWFAFNGKLGVVTKVESQPSRVGADRMVTWANLLGFPYRVKKEHLEMINESR